MSYLPCPATNLSIHCRASGSMSLYMNLPNGKLQSEVSARVYRIFSVFTRKNFAIRTRKKNLAKRILTQLNGSLISRHM